jgi:hypothetical protein
MEECRFSSTHFYFDTGVGGVGGQFHTPASPGEGAPEPVWTPCEKINLCPSRESHPGCPARTDLAGLSSFMKTLTTIV